MSTHPEDNPDAPVRYSNLIHIIEAMILRFMRKAEAFTFPIRTINEDGTEENYFITVVGLNERHAADRARQFALRAPSQKSSSKIGLMMPGNETPNSAPVVKGMLKRNALRAKKTIKASYYHDGMPRPLSLTTSHINALLANANKQEEDTPTAEITPESLQVHLKRCLIIGIVYIGVIGIGIAVFSAGFNESLYAGSVFGRLNPWTLFGGGASIVGTINLIHTFFSAKKILQYINDHSEN